MDGRTYRYFKGKALYPFGHGLSYTHFNYSDLKIDRALGAPAEPVQLTVKIKNDGKRAGEEVVQLYLKPKQAAGRAIKELRGFQRVALQPGEERVLTFTFKPIKDLRTYDEVSSAYKVEEGSYEVQVGASSADIRLQGLYTVEPD
jgi:beta-glucosidase